MSDQANSPGKRAAPRVRSSLPARVETIDGEQNAILENVSRTGARLAMPGLRQGQRLIMTCGSLDCFGVVQWSDGACIGLAFDDPLSDDQVVEVRRATDAGITLEDLEARAAAADWVEGKLGSAVS